MLKYISSNEIDVLVMYDMTRFYRPPPEQVSEELELLRTIMSKYKILIDFAKEPEIGEPMLAELWRFIKAWVVAYERLQTSLRTKYGLLRLKMEGRLYHKPSLVYYYVAWLYNKEIGQVTREEHDMAEKQLMSIIMKYWKNPVVKKTKIPELLAKNELAGLYQRYPKAPKSYLTILRIVKRHQH